MKLNKKTVKQIVLVLSAIKNNDFDEYKKHISELAKIYYSTPEREGFIFLTSFFKMTIPESEKQDGNLICGIPSEEINDFSDFFYKEMKQHANSSD